MPLGDIYVWQVRSFTARLSLSLVDRVRSTLARMPANEEHGGILLGSIIDPHTVEVTGCEFFPSAHRKGTLYDLGSRERERVAMRVRELARVKPMRPVGYFRTHQRPGLFLDQDDFALMEDAFREPGSVALLIRPQPNGPPDAGFFFWDNGDLDRKQTHLVFPFDSEALRARGPIVARPPASAPAASAGAATVMMLALKPYRAVLLWVGAAILSFAMVVLLLRAGAGKAQSSGNPFDLRIERSGDSLMVDWNRNAPALRNASSASLTIDDGGAVQKLMLDRAELEHGSVQFWPQSKQVVVRMDVTSSREISESVTAVVEGGKAASASNRKPTPIAAIGAPADSDLVVKPSPERANSANAAGGEAQSRGNSAEGYSTRAASPPAYPKTRAWQAAEQSSKSPPHPDNAADSGSAAPPSAAASAAAPAGPEPQPQPPPPAARTIHVVTCAVQLEPKAPSEMHRVMGRIPLVGHFGALRYHGGESDFHPPQPEQTLEPKVPGYMAENLKTPVDVAILVSIDKKGKVKQTEVLDGAGTGFGALAADRAAAIDWEPGRVGNKPVASQVVAHFRFRKVEKEVAEAQPQAANGK